MATSAELEQSMMMACGRWSVSTCDVKASMSMALGGVGAAVRLGQSGIGTPDTVTCLRACGNMVDPESARTVALHSPTLSR